MPLGPKLGSLKHPCHSQATGDLGWALVHSGLGFSSGPRGAVVRTGAQGRPGEARPQPALPSGAPLNPLSIPGDRD